MGLASQVFSCEKPRFQDDGEYPAAFFHGVKGVGAEIHDHLMNLRRIGEDESGVRCEVLVDGNGRRQEGPQHLQCFLDNDNWLEWDLFAFRLTAEGEDLLDQILGSMTGLDDLIEVLRYQGIRQGCRLGPFPHSRGLRREYC